MLPSVRNIYFNMSDLLHVLMQISKLGIIIVIFVFQLLSECFKVHRSPHRVNIKGYVTCYYISFGVPVGSYSFLTHSAYSWLRVQCVWHLETYVRDGMNGFGSPLGQGNPLSQAFYLSCTDVTRLSVHKLSCISLMIKSRIYYRICYEIVVISATDVHPLPSLSFLTFAFLFVVSYPIVSAAWLIKVPCAQI